jgi:hypothetical protein
MVKNVACLSCAKRKVRCDRREPCCHCKRRKKGDCTYPDVSSPARIKQLEALVRSLGHSPEEEKGVVNPQAETSPTSLQSPTRPPPAKHDLSNDRSSQRIETASNNDPVIVDEGGERVYLEAYAKVPGVIIFMLTVTDQRGIAGTKGPGYQMINHLIIKALCEHSFLCSLGLVLCKI